MAKAAPETSRRKVAARLELEGWMLRHGGSHDVYTHPEKPGIIALPRHQTLSAGVARTVAKAVPPARPIESVRKDKSVAKALREGAVLASVPLIMDTGRAVRVNVSLDAGTLAAIDEAASARGLTRSAFLASAAREKIAHE